MITRADAAAKRQEAISRPLAQFEASIDRALIEPVDYLGRWIIAIRGIPPAVYKAAMEKYSAAGWQVKLVDDQRDGAYLEFK